MKAVFLWKILPVISKHFSTPAPFLSTPQTPVEWAKVCLVQNNIYGFQGQWWQKYGLGNPNFSQPSFII